MVRLLMNKFFFCGYSGWVGVGYLNFRKVFARNFLSLLMMPSFFCRNVSGRPRRLHTIDFLMSIPPIKNIFPPNVLCYNIKVQNK